MNRNSKVLRTVNVAKPKRRVGGWGGWRSVGGGGWGVGDGGLFQYRISPTNLITGLHYSDVIMGPMASKIPSLTIVYSTADQRTLELRVTGLCAGNSPVTGEFSAQMASNAENIFIWWRHHVLQAQPISTWIVRWECVTVMNEKDVY